jgi:hypothetical protein
MKSLLDVAEERGAVADEDGCFNGAELARVGVPILTSCRSCGATLAAYNAYIEDVNDSPACRECVG